MCPLCNGSLILLGRLGDLTHYRCRCCGADTSEPADADLSEADDEDAERFDGQA